MFLLILIVCPRLIVCFLMVSYGFVRFSYGFAMIPNAFPMLFLSGVFFPIDFLPKFIGYISNVLPLTHLAQGIRLSALYGNSTLTTLPQLGITILWLAIAFAICAFTFKWE